MAGGALLQPGPGARGGLPGLAAPGLRGRAGAGSGRAFPTLYLLHGAGGPAGFGVEEWLGYALTEDLDRMLALGLIEPMIVVLPNGEQGYWMNHAGGGPQVGGLRRPSTWWSTSTPPSSPTGSRPAAVGGLSMGGHGALQLALNHPDVFSASPARTAPRCAPSRTRPSSSATPKWFARYDPPTLVKTTGAPGGW